MAMEQLPRKGWSRIGTGLLDTDSLQN